MEIGQYLCALVFSTLCGMYLIELTNILPSLYTDIWYDSWYEESLFYYSYELTLDSSDRM